VTQSQFLPECGQKARHGALGEQGDGVAHVQKAGGAQDLAHPEQLLLLLLHH